MEHERTIHARNGRGESPERVEIEDTIIVERGGDSGLDEAEEEEYDVVGIVEDESSSVRYAVCYSESADEFIITDGTGALLRDHALAQEILEDFLEHTAADDGES